MLMLERDGTLVQPEQTTNRRAGSLPETIDDHITGQIDQYLSDVATLLADLDQQLVGWHHGASAWSRQDS